MCGSGAPTLSVMFGASGSGKPPELMPGERCGKDAPDVVGCTSARGDILSDSDTTLCLCAAAVGSVWPARQAKRPQLHARTLPSLQRGSEEVQVNLACKQTDIKFLTVI